MTLTFENFPITSWLIKNLHSQAKNILHWLLGATFVDLQISKMVNPSASCSISFLISNMSENTLFQIDSRNNCWTVWGFSSSLLMTWLSPANNETMALIVFLLLFISFEETLLLKQSLTSHGLFSDVFSILYQFSTLHKLLFIWIFITSPFFPYVAYCFLIHYSCLHSSTEREWAFHQYYSAPLLWSNGFLAI